MNCAAVNRIELLRKGILYSIIALLFAVSLERNRIWMTDVFLWKDAVAKSEKKVRAIVNLGIAYLGEAFFKDAEMYLRKGLRLYPAYHKAKYYLAEALYNLGKCEEALYYLKDVELLYTKVLPMFPEKKKMVQESISEAVIYFNLASVYYKLGDMVQAEDYYRKALVINPTNILAREGIVSIMVDKGRNKEAVKEMEELLLRAPEGYKRRQEVEEMILELKGGR